MPVARRAVVGLAKSVLPATVVSAHLESCAAELAAATVPPGELTAVVAQLVAGQRHVAAALANLAGQLDGRQADSAALAEVLLAAAAASGHAADALAAGEHLCEIVADDSHF